MCNFSSQVIQSSVCCVSCLNKTFIQSPATLLGTLVHLLIHAIIQSTQLRGSSTIDDDHASTDSELVLYTSNIRIEKRCDLSYFDCSMVVVGARKANLSILETADPLCLNRMFRKKYPVSVSSVSGNSFVMRERRTARLVYFDIRRW